MLFGLAIPVQSGPFFEVHAASQLKGTIFEGSHFPYDLATNLVSGLANHQLLHWVPAESISIFGEFGEFH